MRELWDAVWPWLLWATGPAVVFLAWWGERRRARREDERRQRGDE